MCGKVDSFHPLFCLGFSFFFFFSFFWRCLSQCNSMGKVCVYSGIDGQDEGPGQTCMPRCVCVWGGGRCVCKGLRMRVRVSVGGGGGRTLLEVGCVKPTAGGNRPTPMRWAELKVGVREP